MIWAPTSTRSSGSSALTVAFVPTGMKTGVSTTPCGVSSRPTRARVVPSTGAAAVTSNVTGRVAPTAPPRSGARLVTTSAADLGALGGGRHEQHRPDQPEDRRRPSPGRSAGPPAQLPAARLARWTTAEAALKGRYFTTSGRISVANCSPKKRTMPTPTPASWLRGEGRHGEADGDLLGQAEPDVEEDAGQADQGRRVAKAVQRDAGQRGAGNRRPDTDEEHDDHRQAGGEDRAPRVTRACTASDSHRARRRP